MRDILKGGRLIILSKEKKVEIKHDMTVDKIRDYLRKSKITLKFNRKTLILILLTDNSTLH